MFECPFSHASTSPALGQSRRCLVERPTTIRLRNHPSHRQIRRPYLRHQHLKRRLAHLRRSLSRSPFSLNDHLGNGNRAEGQIFALRRSSSGGKQRDSRTAEAAESLISMRKRKLRTYYKIEAVRNL